MRSVPVISLKDFHSAQKSTSLLFTDNLFSALKDYGFVTLVDHPIEIKDLQLAYSEMRAVFQMSPETKARYIDTHPGFQRGYTPLGTEHAKDQTVADLKEFWHVGRDGLLPENIWPSEYPHFKTIMQKVFSQLEFVCLQVLQALTPALDLPQDYFDNLTGNGNSILRLLHYPPIPADADPRAVRAAAHEDINLITALVSATSAGLQLKDRDGSWLDVVAPENSIIIDAGDMLARITNEVIPATTHRVVNPEGANISRYSMPFFMHPHPEAMLTCLQSCKGSGAKYPDILSQDFLMERLRAIGLA